MIPEIILSAALSFTPTEKKVINNLQTKLKKDGYDISQYLDDSRFEIYKFKKGGKFINYADTTQSWYMKVDSIEKCADFVEEYYSWLKKAEDEFGPSPEYITSQLQLETNRGQYTGKCPLINSFISVYLNKPGRRREFYKHLTDFLDLFANTNDSIVYPKDIFDVKGSWAGAYGIAQGMPKIIKKYGKDFDGDNLFDPMNIPDAIGFMARYLADHNFKKNHSDAIKKYNIGHPFYESSIEKHTKKLTEIMKKRHRTPLEKIRVLTNIPTIYIKPVKSNQLKRMTPFTTRPQLPKKKLFIKHILFNRRKGKK